MTEPNEITKILLVELTEKGKKNWPLAVVFTTFVSFCNAFLRAEKLQTRRRTATARLFRVCRKISAASITIIIFNCSYANKRLHLIERF